MNHARLAQPKELSGFIRSLQEPRTPYISPKRLSQALGVKLANTLRGWQAFTATPSVTRHRSDCRVACARW